MSARATKKPVERHSLEATLGYRFADPALLTLALTHRSIAYEERNGADIKNPPGTDNEQLEFLGDSVLGLIITELLLEHFPTCDEGNLTRLRAALVSRKRMAQLALVLDLGPHLLVGPSAERAGIRERPTVLANAAEAVLAAMYLDAVRSGTPSELATLRKLLRRQLLEPDLPELRKAVAERNAHGALRDHKTILQERVQSLDIGRLRYADTDQTGPPHDRRFTVEVRLENPGGAYIALAEGHGPSKRDAQQQAAGRALEVWDEKVGPREKR